MSVLALKVTCGTEKRRLGVPPTLSLSDVKQRLAQEWPTVAENKIIQYKDDDGDDITIGTEAGWQEAVRTATEHKNVLLVTLVTPPSEGFPLYPGLGPLGYGRVLKKAPNGIVLIETTMAAIPTDPNCMQASQPGAVTLALKLVRLERALRYFEKREGFQPVKLVILDCAAFEILKEALPLKENEFFRFFDVLFSREIPRPPPPKLVDKCMANAKGELGAAAREAAADASTRSRRLGFLKEHTLGGSVSQLQKLMEAIFREVEGIEESPSTKYPLADGRFRWDNRMNALIDRFLIESAVSDPATAPDKHLEIDFIMKAYSPRFGDREISPPNSPLRALGQLVALEEQGKQRVVSEKKTPPALPLEPVMTESDARVTWADCLTELYKLYRGLRFLPLARTFEKAPKGYFDPE